MLRVEESTILYTTSVSLCFKEAELFVHTLNTVASNFNSAQTIQYSMNAKGYIYSMEWRNGMETEER